MARRKSHPDTVRTKFELAERLRTVRSELYGERGGPELARRLGIPIRTWYNYESGVTVPSEVILRFIELTLVEPTWLLHGSGPKFRRHQPADEPGGKSGTIVDLLRTALRQLEGGGADAGPTGPGQWPARREPGRLGHPGDGKPANAPSDGKPAEAGSDPEGSARALSGAERTAAVRQGLSVRMEGDSMSPIIADGAIVAFSDEAQEPEDLDGKLVVAWIDGQPLVRWFDLSGRFAVLRAENASAEPSMILVDLRVTPDSPRLRRVLWIDTPH